MTAASPRRRLLALPAVALLVALAARGGVATGQSAEESADTLPYAVSIEGWEPAPGPTLIPVYGPVEYNPGPAPGVVEVVAGWLYGRYGALWLWFDASGPRDPLTWRGEARDRTLGGGLGEAASESWGGVPRLIPRGRALYSVVLPHDEPGQGLAARLRLVDEPSALGTDLVTIRPVELTVSLLWTARGRAYLMGQTAGLAVLLDLGPEGDATVVAVDGSGLERRSAPLAVEPAALGLAGGCSEAGCPVALPELRPPLAAPLGGDGYVFFCGDGELCLAVVGASEIVIDRRAAPRGELLPTDTGGVVLMTPGECLAVGRSSDRLLEPAALDCPDGVYDAEAAWEGLPVDGRFVDGVRTSVRYARAGLALRPLPDPPALRWPLTGDEATAETSGVLVLSGWSFGHWDLLTYRLRLDALARGTWLRVGYAHDPHGAVLTPDFELMLGPEDVVVRVLGFDGTPLYRVEVDVTFALYFGRSACWQGVVLVGSRDDVVGRGLAATSLPAELGACE
jgi:hypothetical protein